MKNVKSIDITVLGKLTILKSSQIAKSSSKGVLKNFI